MRPPDAAAILLRDRAFVLRGFDLGGRGSELARVDLEHVKWRPDGLFIKTRTRRPTTRARPS
jgi:integrase